MLNRLKLKFFKRIHTTKTRISNEVSNNEIATLLKHQIKSKWDVIDYLDARSTKKYITHCPLCGVNIDYNNLKQYISNCKFEGGLLIRYQCASCDLIFGPEKMLMLSETQLSKEYEWHYRVFSEADSTENEIKIFHNLNPEKTGKYLNWGAGAWSKTIDRLRKDGWDVYGYEPHKASTSNHFIITDINRLRNMRFDGIFSNNVLEHLRYPIEDLKEMATFLKPQGRMVHATPCFDYMYEYTRFHLFFYLGKSKEILAYKSGLEIENFFVEGELMSLVCKKSI